MSTKRIITASDNVTTFTVSAATEHAAAQLREYCETHGIEMCVYRSQYNPETAALKRAYEKLQKAYGVAAFKGDTAAAAQLRVEIEQFEREHNIN